MSAEEQKSGGCTVSGCIAMLFFGGIGVIILAEIPDWVVGRYRNQRDEVGMQVEQLRAAEIAYQKKHGTYIPAAQYPPPAGDKAQKWNVKSSGNFQTLGWIPVSKDKGHVRGSFSVTTTPDDFKAMGISDIDGDGVYATYIATKSSLPTLVDQYEY